MSSEDEVYDVEAIIGKRSIKGKTQYKVRWLGYTEKDNSWEDAENLNCSDLIKDFETNGVKPPFIVKEVIYASRNKEEDEIYYKVINNKGDIKEIPSHILRISYQQKIIEFLQGQAECKERDLQNAKEEYIDKKEVVNKNSTQPKKSQSKKETAQKVKPEKKNDKKVDSKEESDLEKEESEHLNEKSEPEKAEPKKEEEPKPELEKEEEPKTELKKEGKEPELIKDEKEPELGKEKSEPAAEKTQKKKKTEKK